MGGASVLMSISKEEALLAFLKVHGAYEPARVPNQKAFTFLSKETGLPQVWKWDGEGISQFTDMEDRVLSVYHSPDGTKTIVGMDHKGNEKQQLYLLTEGGRSVEELVVSEEHFHQFGGWSPDGEKIAFSSNRRHPGYFDVFTLDLPTKIVKTVYESETNCDPVCWTKDGESLILKFAETNIDNSLFAFHLQTGKMTRIGKEGEYARRLSIRLGRDGKTGYLVTDEGRDTMGISRFNFDNPSELIMLYGEDKLDIEEIALSPDEKSIAFSINEGGISKLGILHISDQTVEYIDYLPTGVYQSISWMGDSKLITGLKSAIHPGDIWSIDLQGKTSERLTVVGKADEISGSWHEPELCHYASFDGLQVPYFLYGKKDEPQPVVVYIHGGPEHQIRAEYNPVIQFLAAQGFAVVAPNVRGSMGYGRKYVKLDDVRKRMDSVADLKWLVEDMIVNHGADPDRIGVMGRSYGGFMVLAAITHYPDIWSAAVDIVGISHFKTFLENTGPWRRRLREQEYGSLKEDSDFFEEIAPLNHTEKIKVPLLVFHGRNDTRVPVSEAEQLTRDLKEQGKEVELIVFEDEGHQTEKIENHILMNSRIVGFMEEKLNG